MMIDSLAVRNFFVILSSLAPLVAFFVASVKQFDSARVAFLVESALFGSFLGIYFWLPYVPSKTVPAVLSLYPLFMFLFNLVLLIKFKPRVFSKILAVSLMLSFVLTEFHELPAFVYSYLSLDFLDPGKLIYALSPLYALVVFWLAARIFNLSLSIKEKAVLMFYVLGIWVFYWINPLIDINEIPSALAYVKRSYCFGILALAFLWGGNPGNE